MSTRGRAHAAASCSRALRVRIRYIDISEEASITTFVAEIRAEDVNCSADRSGANHLSILKKKRKKFFKVFKKFNKNEETDWCLLHNTTHIKCFGGAVSIGR